MEMKIYAGIIHEGDYGENDDALFVGDSEDSIAMRFESDFGCSTVSIIYWISDREKTRADLTMNHVLQIAGAIDADYTDRYSDLTGYLWTDEDLNIGGHDLLKELKSHLGKFLYMEVKIQELEQSKQS